MNQPKEYLPGVLNGLTGIGVILVSFWIDLLPIPVKTAKPAGFLIVFAGMSLVVWATFHLKAAIAGEVEPVLDVLVKEGPYRHVRHPVYLGFTVALIGITILTRSLPGLISVCVFFLPTEVYRATLEEKALARKFGTEWEDYCNRTGFMVPLFRKK